MERTKIVLLFQAIVTLIIGLVFFFQMLNINSERIQDLIQEITVQDALSEENGAIIGEIKQRFSIAAYTLFLVSITELLIISRFFK
jgi:hypothetical protein|tara:strand:- start:99 stop:356 length:258 start_codon:yes stop_codon:yes gene_type:complete